MLRSLDLNFNILIEDKRNTIHGLKDDKSIIFKGANKGAKLIVWDGKDYLKEVSKHWEYKEVYLKFSNNLTTFASMTFHLTCESLERIKKRGDLLHDEQNYFLVKDPTFERFYLLAKIQKRLHDVPGRPVISNRFLHRKYFLIPRLSFTAPCPRGKVIYERRGQLPGGKILCIIDVIGPHSNIPHDEGLVFLKDFLSIRVAKQTTADTLKNLLRLY